MPTGFSKRIPIKAAKKSPRFAPGVKFLRAAREAHAFGAENFCACGFENFSPGEVEKGRPSSLTPLKCRFDCFERRSGRRVNLRWHGRVSQCQRIKSY
jgi:hypothetical protein